MPARASHSERRAPSLVSGVDSRVAISRSCRCPPPRMQLALECFVCLAVLGCSRCARSVCSVWVSICSVLLGPRHPLILFLRPRPCEGHEGWLTGARFSGDLRQQCSELVRVAHSRSMVQRPSLLPTFGIHQDITGGSGSSSIADRGSFPGRCYRQWPALLAANTTSLLHGEHASIFDQPEHLRRTDRNYELRVSCELYICEL
jgi:hypothetical protein